MTVNEAKYESLPGEIWRDIIDEEIDCQNEYQISSFGRARSFKYGKVKLLKTQVYRASGYQYIGLYSKGKKATANVLVHILVAKAFLPNPNNKPQVNHRDGNKKNNHVSNLEWVTPSENITHAYELGLAKRGCNHCRAALPPEQVREIRCKCIPGDLKFGINAFARKLNVSDSVISNAYHRITYRDIN